MSLDDMDTSRPAEVDRGELLARARSDDAQALCQLLDSYRPYLAVIARACGGRRLRGKAGESDLVQDAQLQALRSFASFRGGSVAEFAAWLRQIVTRVTGHALREQFDAAKRDAGREQPLAGMSSLLSAGSSTPSRYAVRQETSALVAEAIARLPEEMQAVLLGRHVDELSHAELAERLKRSEGAVRVLYTRALRRLREEIGQ